MLVHAIDSVLNQTFDELEVIVVDDASTLDVEKAVMGFDDDRIRYVRHSRNKGVAATKNAGIQAATGQYIGFLDDDDRYLEKKIERQLEVFEQSPPSVGLVYCGCLYVTEKGQCLWKTSPISLNRDILHHTGFIGATALVRRECFEETGLFDESFECFEDRDMWLRISERYDIRFCPEPLYEARIHPFDRITDNLERKIRSLDMFYEKHAKRAKFLSRKMRRKVFSVYHLQRASFFYQYDMPREGREEIMNSIFLNPTNSKSWRLLLEHALGMKVGHLLQTLRSGFPESPPNALDPVQKVR